jgi:hypothetical protein
MIPNKEINITEKLPYTVIGHSGLSIPVMSITLTGSGIKAIAKLVENEDSVRIKEWVDVEDEGQKERYYQRISIIKHNPSKKVDRK